MNWFANHHKGAIGRKGLCAGLARIALLAFTVLALVQPAHAEEQEVEFDAFRPFTLYNADTTPLKDDVLFVFHGFLSAMPNGAYKRLHKAFGEHYSVIGFNYEYFEFDENDAVMKRAWNTLLKGRNVTFIGTSLGGFWANRYAEEYGIQREILINPVVEPAEQLKQFIGDRFSEKRNVTVKVTPERVATYSTITAAPKSGIQRLVILSRDDDVLDYRMAEKAYEGPGNELVIFDEGGHTLNLRDTQFMDVIRTFLAAGKTSG